MDPATKGCAGPLAARSPERTAGAAWPFRPSTLTDIIAVLVLLAPGTGQASRPPPPCVPSALDPARVLGALRESAPFAPLKAATLRVELGACAISRAEELATVHVEHPAAASAAGLVYQTTLQVRVARPSGAPEDTPTLRARITALANDVPARARAAEGAPRSIAWRAAHRVVRAEYDDRPPAGTACITYVADPLGEERVASLSWCVALGVVRYSAGRLGAFHTAELDSLSTWLTTHRPGRALHHVTLSRNPSASAPVWVAQGELTGGAGGPRERFAASQGPDGSWRSQ